MDSLFLNRDTEMVLKILLLLAGFATVTVGVRGDTWHKERKGLKRITTSGWATLLLGLLTLALGVGSEIQQSRLSSLAAANEEEKHEELLTILRQAIPTVAQTPQAANTSISQAISAQPTALSQRESVNRYLEGAADAIASTTLTDELTKLSNDVSEVQRELGKTTDDKLDPLLNRSLMLFLNARFATTDTEVAEIRITSVETSKDEAQLSFRAKKRIVIKLPFKDITEIVSVNGKTKINLTNAKSSTALVDFEVAGVPIKLNLPIPPLDRETGGITK